MPDLTDITGVASATQAKLNEEGVSSIDDLAASEPSDIETVSEAKARKIIRRAKQHQISSKTAADLLDEYRDQEYISTGVDALDVVLGGGWEPETIGLIYGSSGTGKTQVLFSSLGTASSGGTVVYLMTEMQSKSIADRLKNLSGHVDDLENIHIYEAHDVDEQYESYLAIGEDFDEIDLFVVDSFTAQFRMNPEFDGRQNLGDRSAEMGRHLREIGEMSRVFQCPVVMTGQVYENPDAWGKSDNPYGGQKMEHFVSYFVRMTEGEGVLKEAALENHPGKEEDSVKLKIEDDGLEEAGQ